MRFLFLLGLVVSISIVSLAQKRDEAPLPCIEKKFSIVAHIVLDSSGNANILESDILDNIDFLNQHFEPICVSFEICDFNYVANYQYDSLHEDKERPEIRVKNDLKDRINMMFIEGIEEVDGICGKATVGGIGTSGFVNILKSCVGPSDYTISHELGHYFGLVHTFEGSGVELADGSNCETAGDQICDTPADPFVVGDPQESYVKDCRFISTKKDANDDFYNAHVGNIMSYYECQCEFTVGQYRKMAETYLNSSQTNW
ncbi:MAG: M43 family zinc metalloprotease [Vicingaceae bacterium]